MNPVHSFPSCFFEVHFGIILPSTPRSSMFPFSCKLSKANCNLFYSASLVPIALPIIILFYYPIAFRKGKNYEDFRHVIFSILLVLHVSSKIFLSYLFPNTCSLYTRDRIHSRRTANKSLKV